MADEMYNAVILPSDSVSLSRREDPRPDHRLQRFISVDWFVRTGLIGRQYRMPNQLIIFFGCVVHMSAFGKTGRNGVITAPLPAAIRR